MTANILWLPLANRIKRVTEIEAQRMELVVEGVMAIQAGANPRLIQQKLRSFLAGEQKAGEKADEQKAA